MTQSDYRYEAPPWAARALCLLAFLLATGSAVLAYYWKTWCYFRADREGLWFPSDFKVGYSSSFRNTDRAVAALRNLWRRHGDSG